MFYIWRMVLFIISILSYKFFTYDPSFPYANVILNDFGLSQWLFSWGSFDGVHYITIIDRGYESAALIQAFFPAFPMIVRFLNLVINNTLISGLLVSNLSFLLFLFIWYLFIEKRYSSKLASLSTLIILLFPSSLFFGAIYNESLFLLSVILSFWFAESKKYFLAVIFIALASATRIVGIFLIPAILIEIVFEDYNFQNLFSSMFNKNKKELKKLSTKFKKNLSSINKKLKPIGIISLGSLGLISYMLFLYLKFGDPLYFFHVQSEFGGTRQESLVSYPRVVYRYIKILLTARPFNLIYFSSVKELVVGVFGLATILLSFKKVKFSYFIFALIAFILPTLTGTFSSMSRYILVSFPIFIVLAGWVERSKFFRYTWFIFSGILLILNTMLFIQGHWVA
jgi:hypothetical protein